MDLDSLFNEARALHGTGNLVRASAVCEGVLACQPQHSGAHLLMGMIALKQGNALKALLCADRAIELAPRQADIHSHRGLILQALGRLEEAVMSYNRAIALDRMYADAYFNRGIALQILKRPEDAIASYDLAIAVDPQLAEAYYNRGSVQKDLSRFEAALASYDSALAILPDFVEAHLARALTLYALHRGDEAVRTYDSVIALQPALAAAHFNRGNILKDLRRFEEAMASYKRALVLRPNHLDTKKGLLACTFERLSDPALTERLSMEISAAEVERKSAALRERLSILDCRAFHDLEYTDYLIASGYSDAHIIAANACLREICARNPMRAPLENPKALEITGGEGETISRFRKSAPRYHMPLSIRRCLNEENDWAALEDQYLSSRPEVTVIDKILSEEYLTELRKFCLISQIWKREYKAHYLGANVEEGFIGALQLQMAIELQRRMPRVFGGHDLTQLWAFKYSSIMGRGVGAHADFARVNLNFWITPDDANLDPLSGGLIVHDVPAPSSWSYRDYNTNEEKIYTFLKARAAGSRTIPYKCNRAVLFNSNLFHETDQFRFKPGYQNRRINVTYLFGKGLQY